MTDDRNQEDQDLARQVAGLPRSIEPPADLWPGIRARIAPARRATWQWQLAAAVVLIALSSLATWVLTRRATPLAVPVVVAHDAVTIEQYASAARDMEGALASTPMSVETRALLEQNLRLIDSVIAECRAALAADSANAALRELLGGAERQRLDFLRQAARLPRS